MNITIEQEGEFSEAFSGLVGPQCSVTVQSRILDISSEVSALGDLH